MTIISLFLPSGLVNLYLDFLWDIVINEKKRHMNKEQKLKKMIENPRIILDLFRLKKKKETRFC